MSAAVLGCLNCVSLAGPTQESAFPCQLLTAESAFATSCSPQPAPARATSEFLWCQAQTIPSSLSVPDYHAAQNIGPHPAGLCTTSWQLPLTSPLAVLHRHEPPWPCPPPLPQLLSCIHTPSCQLLHEGVRVRSVQLAHQVRVGKRFAQRLKCRRNPMVPAFTQTVAEGFVQSIACNDSSSTVDIQVTLPLHYQTAVLELA